MGFTIHGTAKPILRAASRASIESYFVGLPSPLREQMWLDSRNRYRVNCTDTFVDDVNASQRLRRPLSKHKHTHLTAYIAASSPTHAIDGWSFLGRSIDSALRGDTYSAAHFAYYAELRAAMSLLASEGIGVFSGIHAVVGEHEIKRFPTKGQARTHSLVWPLLRYWSTLSRSGDLLDELIQPVNIPLSTWLSEMGCPIRVRALGQNWLASWGIDLATVREDHDARNLASYRPSEFRYAPSRGAADISGFITSLWELFEPGSERRFHGVERQLLKRAWQASGKPPPLQSEIERVGLTVSEAENWANLFVSAGNSLPIMFAESSTSIEEPTCHLRMISRAALLLFLASGSARQLLQRAGYSAETTAFWWKKHGIDRGLWSPNNSPDDPLDAWADIADAIEDLAAWSDSNMHASLQEMRQSHGSNIQQLGAFELVGIWSLMP